MRRGHPGSSRPCAASGTRWGAEGEGDEPVNHPSPTPMFRSFRARMALSHGAVLALIVLVLGGTSYLLLGRTLDRTATGAVAVAAQEEVERVAATGVTSAAATNPPDNDIPSAA